MASRLLLVSTWLLFSAAAIGFAARYGVDWLHIDDSGLVFWVQEIHKGGAGFWDIFHAGWNNDHPVAALIYVFWLTTKLYGVHFKPLIYLTFVLACLSTLPILTLAFGCIRSLVGRALLIAAVFAVMLHGSQAALLLFAYEVCWFAINFLVFVNLALIERRHSALICLAFANCAIASLFSAQGAFSWFAIALHLALLTNPQRLIYAGIALAGGAFAVVRVALHAHGLSPYPNFHQSLEFALYVIQLFGGILGSENPAVLLLSGSLLLTTAALLVALTMTKASLNPCDRAGIAAIAVGALAVLGFALGRFHLGLAWATSSFHAASMFVPFYVGTLLLAVSAATERTLVPRLAGAVLTAVLLVGTATSVPYALRFARTWTMMQGYAMWVACYTDAPVRFKARAAGLESYDELFVAQWPLLREMCATPDGLQAALIRWPTEFEQISQSRPEMQAALEALWRVYATNMGWQRAFVYGHPDAATSLLEFGRTNALAGTPAEPFYLKSFEGLLRSL